MYYLDVNYSLLIKNNIATTDKLKILLKEKIKEDIWQEILDYDINNYISENKDKFKQILRDGIPDNLRGYVWLALAEIDKYKIPGLYKDLLEIKLDKSNPIVIDIIKDLPRSCPNNTFYKQDFGLGQIKLFNVLKCFSYYYKKTGYLQAMSFLVANFLCYIDEESAFWLMYVLMEKYNLKTVYELKFPGLNKKYYKLLVLLKKYCENIYIHLFDRKITPSLYCVNWFMTLFFSNNNIISIVIRIFDIYLFEKEKTIYKFILGFFKCNESIILKAKEMEDVFNVLKTFQSNIKFDDLITYTYSFDIHNNYLNSLDYMYDELIKHNKTDEFIDFMNYFDNLD